MRCCTCPATGGNQEETFFETVILRPDIPKAVIMSPRRRPAMYRTELLLTGTSANTALGILSWQAGFLVKMPQEGGRLAHPASRLLSIMIVAGLRHTELCSALL